MLPIRCENGEKPIYIHDFHPAQAIGRVNVVTVKMLQFYGSGNVSTKITI
jgi:hypothetical protein